RKTLGGLVGFGGAGLRFHHHVEDTEYFPAILEKGGDPAQIGPLQTEHHEIDALLDRMDAVAVRLQAGGPDDGAVAEATQLASTFADHVRKHLDAEEPVFFPLLQEHIPDAEAHKIAARVAKNAPRKGISWLFGGVKFAMTPAEGNNFLSSFPKPILWMRPMLLRAYRRNCATLGVPEAFD
ncbi:MAG: hemerythrin domain-containing protein, partial [Acidimicrobiales bacterium]